MYDFVPSWVAAWPLRWSSMFPLALALERFSRGKCTRTSCVAVFLLSWLPITFYAFFTQNNKQWSHTQHTRVLRLEDVQSKQV